MINGLSDVFTLRNRSVKSIASDCTGTITAISSVVTSLSDRPSEECELSVWIHHHGLLKVGTLVYNRSAAYKARNESSYEAWDHDSYSAICWHPKGKKLCVIIDGFCAIFLLSWIDTETSKPMENVTAMTEEYNEDADVSRNNPPHLVKVRAKIQIMSEVPYPVTSYSLYNSINYLFVGLVSAGKEHGILMKLNWDGGYVVGYHKLSENHNMYYPLSTSAVVTQASESETSLEVPLSLCAYSEERHREEGDEEEGTLAKAKAINDNDDSEKLGTAYTSYLVGWVDSLRLLITLLGDGSLVICSPFKKGKGKSSLLGSVRVLPVLNSAGDTTQPMDVLGKVMQAILLEHRDKPFLVSLVFYTKPPKEEEVASMGLKTVGIRVLMQRLDKTPKNTYTDVDIDVQREEGEVIETKETMSASLTTVLSFDITQELQACGYSTEDDRQPRQDIKLQVVQQYSSPLLLLFVGSKCMYLDLFAETMGLSGPTTMLPKAPVLHVLDIDVAPDVGYASNLAIGNSFGRMLVAQTRTRAGSRSGSAVLHVAPVLLPLSETLRPCMGHREPLMLDMANQMLLVYQTDASHTSEGSSLVPAAEEWVASTSPMKVEKDAGLSAFEPVTTDRMFHKARLPPDLYHQLQLHLTRVGNVYRSHSTGQHAPQGGLGSFFTGRYQGSVVGKEPTGLVCALSCHNGRLSQLQHPPNYGLPGDLSSYVALSFGTSLYTGCGPQGLQELMLLHSPSGSTGRNGKNEAKYGTASRASQAGGWCPVWIYNLHGGDQGRSWRYLDISTVSSKQDLVVDVISSPYLTTFLQKGDRAESEGENGSYRDIAPSFKGGDLVSILGLKWILNHTLVALCQRLVTHATKSQTLEYSLEIFSSESGKDSSGYAGRRPKLHKCFALPAALQKSLSEGATGAGAYAFDILELAPYCEQYESGERVAALVGDHKGKYIASYELTATSFNGKLTSYRSRMLWEQSLTKEGTEGLEFVKVKLGALAGSTTALSQSTSKGPGKRLIPQAPTPQTASVGRTSESKSGKKKLTVIIPPPEGDTVELDEVVTRTMSGCKLTSLSSPVSGRKRLVGNVDSENAIWSCPIGLYALTVKSKLFVVQIQSIPVTNQASLAPQTRPSNRRVSLCFNRVARELSVVFDYVIFPSRDLLGWAMASGTNSFSSDKATITPRINKAGDTDVFRDVEKAEDVEDVYLSCVFLCTEDKQADPQVGVVQSVRKYQLLLPIPVRDGGDCRAKAENSALPNVNQASDGSENEVNLEPGLHEVKGLLISLGGQSPRSELMGVVSGNPLYVEQRTHVMSHDSEALASGGGVHALAIATLSTAGGGASLLQYSSACNILLHLANYRNSAAVFLAQEMYKALKARPSFSWLMIDSLEECLRELVEEHIYLQKRKDRYGSADWALWCSKVLELRRLRRKKCVAPKLPRLKRGGEKQTINAGAGPTLLSSRHYRGTHLPSGVTYAGLVRYIFAVDAMLLIDLLSRLGRKMEPSVQQHLLPVALYSPITKSQLRSPLSLYDDCLARGWYTHASRLLTLACEHVGGCESFPSTLESLNMALELLWRLLMSLDLSLVSDCLSFCWRLELMLDHMVLNETRAMRDTDSNDSSANKKGTIKNLAPLSIYTSTQGQLLSPAELGASLEGNTGASKQGHEGPIDTIAYFLGGGVLWKFIENLDSELYPEVTERTLDARLTSNIKANKLKTDSKHNTYTAFNLVREALGEQRLREILGVDGDSSDVSDRLQTKLGKGLGSTCVTLALDKFARQKRHMGCAVIVNQLRHSTVALQKLAWHSIGGCLEWYNHPSASSGVTIEPVAFLVLAQEATKSLGLSIDSILTQTLRHARQWLAHELTRPLGLCTLKAATSAEVAATTVSLDFELYLPDGLDTESPHEAMWTLGGVILSSAIASMLVQDFTRAAAIFMLLELDFSAACCLLLHRAKRNASSVQRDTVNLVTRLLAVIYLNSSPVEVTLVDSSSSEEHEETEKEMANENENENEKKEMTWGKFSMREKKVITKETKLRPMGFRDGGALAPVMVLLGTLLKTRESESVQSFLTQASLALK